MSERSLTVIVPVHAPGDAELDNLEVVLEELVKAKPTLVYVAEQIAAGGVERAAVLTTRFDAVEHLSVVSNRPLIQTGLLVNQAALRATTDSLWIHDASLVLPFCEIVPDLEKGRYVAAKPFSHFFKLPRRASDQFVASRRLTSEQSEGRTPIGQSLGKSSYVVDREVFLALGGLSEAFSGPADAGFELLRRLKCFFDDVFAVPDVVGVQLHRPVPETEATLRASNKSLQDRLTERIDDDVDTYLSEHLATCISVDLARLRRLSRHWQRDRAFRATLPTPPPRYPKTMGGDLWAVTTFFNPSGYRNKKENYDRFRAGLSAVGVPLLAVELAFDHGAFELEEADANRLVQVRGGDALWQKERLLNVGISRLPASCDKVAWLDADVLFSNEDWPAAVADALERYVVVQPFASSVRLEPGETTCDIDDLPVGSAEHELLHGVALGVANKGHRVLSRYLEHGHTGYAWAARRNVLDRHGLYDCNILGNADLSIAYAMFGGRRFLKTERFGPKATEHLAKWADAFFEDVRGSVSHVDGVVYHLWHGYKSDRLYDRRLRVLIDNDFDPEADLVCSPGGAYRWASDKPEFHRWCREYFSRRREDTLERLGAS